MGQRAILAALFGLVVCAGLACAGSVDARPRPRRLARLSTARASGRVAPSPPPVSRPPEAEPRLEAPEPAQLVPAGARLDTPARQQGSPARRWGMFAGGMTLFLVGWGADLGLSYGLGVERAGLAFIPVFGPLAQMGTRISIVAPADTGNAQIDGMANTRIDAVNSAAQTMAYVVLSLDCAIQLAGLTLAIVGALPPRRGPSERGPSASRVSLAAMGPGRAGLALTF